MAGEARGDLVLVGYVGKPHGVRGAVKIVAETDDPARFEEFDEIFVETGGGLTAFAVTSVRLQDSARGTIPVLTLEGIEGRDAADALRGAAVLVPEDELELEDDEFFLHDLVGLSALDEDGEPIGRIDDVLALPAGPVLVVGRANAADALIPAVPEFIIEITDEHVRIRVIEGLLDA